MPVHVFQSQVDDAVTRVISSTKCRKCFDRYNTLLKRFFYKPHSPVVCSAIAPTGAAKSSVEVITLAISSLWVDHRTPTFGISLTKAMLKLAALVQVS